MGKKRKMPKVMLTLEAQLATMPERPTFPNIAEPWMGEHVQPTIAAQVAWDDRRAELQRAIRYRDAKRLVDPGRDASGNFGVSPLAAQHHTVDTAPKDMRAGPDSQFPKRITTQRVIDRLKARGNITETEWKAANTLWEWWCAAQTGDRLTAAYEPVTVYSPANPGALVARRMEAAQAYVVSLSLIPNRCLGIVKHVVINDWELSEWGVNTRRSSRSKRREATNRLSQGLQALARSMGY